MPKQHVYPYIGTPQLPISIRPFENFIFAFKTDLSGVVIPRRLNNPFGAHIPEIGQIAAGEFREFIAGASERWGHDFRVQKGKMFGVLAVEKSDNTFGYIGTVSGKLNGGIARDKFVPSAFDDASDTSFIDRGMQALTEMGGEIEAAESPAHIRSLKAERKQKSRALQQRLFENYNLMNRSGKTKNLSKIFRDASLGNPPSAAGDCAAPKLLHFAFKHDLRPVAIAEFWWGNPAQNPERRHGAYYPACRDKCKPVLEYMLEDEGLYRKADADH